MNIASKWAPRSWTIQREWFGLARWRVAWWRIVCPRIRSMPSPGPALDAMDGRVLFYAADFGLVEFKLFDLNWSRLVNPPVLCAPQQVPRLKGFPWAFHCTDCGQVAFYLRKRPLKNLPVFNPDVLKLDGTQPQLGDRAECGACGAVFHYLNVKAVRLRY